MIFDDKKSRAPYSPKAMIVPSDYRAWLKSIFDQRARENPRYSLRAFARDAGITPSRLSQILRGRQGLSPAKADVIAKGLGLGKAETEHFRLLVTAKDSRSRLARRRAEEALANAGSPPDSFTTLKDEQFQLIADWHHLAILEVLTLASPPGDTAGIARKLGLDEARTQEALDRLSRLGFVKLKSGRWVAVPARLRTPSNTPSEAIRRFHGQILDKAKAAIEGQSLEEREFSTLIFRVDSRQMETLKSELGALRRRFRDEAIASSANAKHRPDQVYAFSFQLFRLSAKGNPL